MLADEVGFFEQVTWHFFRTKFWEPRDRSPSARNPLAADKGMGSVVQFWRYGLLFFGFFAFHDSVNWISSLSHKPLSWDFTNMWFGGKLALSGQLGVLFDVDSYRAAMRAAFSPTIADSEWSYPPSILLLGAPLALLPLPLAWAVWSLGGVAALAALVRSLGLPWLGLPALILSAAFADTFVLGQNGAYTAALLLGGLWLAPRRPGWAGLDCYLACSPASLNLGFLCRSAWLPGGTGGRWSSADFTALALRCLRQVCLVRRFGLGLSR